MKTKNEKLPLNGDIEHFLGVNMKMLSMTGLKITLDTNEKVKKTKYSDKILLAIAIAIGSTVGVFQMWFMLDSLMQGRKHLAMQICSDMLSNLLCVTKGIRLATTDAEIQRVLQEIVIVWRKNPQRAEHRMSIMNQATKTLFYCKIFIVTVSCAVFGYGVPPFKNYLIHYIAQRTTNHTFDYSERVTHVKYPFPIAEPVTYFSVVLEEEYLLFADALYWACCDTLFAQLTTHISLQFQILQQDVESLINNELAEDRLQENLVIFIKRHKELLSICDLVEHIFSPVVLTTVMLSAMNICVNVMEIHETIANGMYFFAILHTSLFVTTFLQILFYCTFAEALTEQTSLIAEAIYNSNWTNKSRKFRSCLQMMILRSQHPFYCTAYGFFPIGHKRLTMIINAAFSYYMMIQTTS